MTTQVQILSAPTVSGTIQIRTRTRPGGTDRGIANGLDDQLGVGSQFDEDLAAATSRPVRHAAARWWT